MAAPRSETISTSSAFNVVPPANVSSQTHLQETSKTEKACDATVQPARARATPTPVLRIRYTLVCEVVIAPFVLSVHDAGAAPCLDASAGLIAAAAKAMAPFAAVFALGKVLCITVTTAASDDAHPLGGNGLHVLLHI